MLSHSARFSPEFGDEFFAAIPAAPAVFLLRGEDPASQPYVSKTTNLRRRLVRLLGPAEERSRRLNLRERVRTVDYSATGSDFESGLLLYEILRHEFPRSYRDRLRLRFAPLLKFHMENEYPRVSVTTRLGRLRGRSLYYGPFPSRTFAEKFANDSLDFFKLRRCVDDLTPDPAFPGCIYSEMKMCLAPCFKGCTDEQYRGEVGRVQSYFETGGQSLARELAGERERASAALEFENAAALHARVEKLAPVTGLLPDIVRRLDRLAGVIVQPSAEPNAVALFRIDGGMLTGPILFSIAPQQTAHLASAGSKVQSMESRLAETLAERPAVPPSSALELMEHLAILKRWYYRTSKVGEAFFADTKGELPLRRIVRGISRVLRGEKPAAEAAAPSLVPVRD